MGLTGLCNRCGNCCFVGPFKCENLEVSGLPGTPNATRCKVYQSRYTDMPIMLTAPNGAIVRGYCLHGSKAEEMELTKLIHEGQCSLEVTDG